MNRRRIEVHPELLKIEEIDITESYQDTTQAQVCRTCANTNNRNWQHSPEQLMEAYRNGADPEDLKCQPTKTAMTVKVLQKADWRDRIVPLTFNSRHRATAFVDTCGHVIANKCRSCEHFNPINVEVPYSPSGAEVHWRMDRTGAKETRVPYTDDDSPIRYWKVQVGGSCSIPAEGIVVDGKITYCMPSPRGKAVESPSCGNCKWLYYTGSQWSTEELEINRNAQLTPWERAQAMASAGPDQSPGQMIGLALWRKQTDPHGRIHWYRAKLLKAGFHGGQLKYRVKFVDNNIEAIISADDDRYRVYVDNVDLGNLSEAIVFDNPPFVAVEIAYPHNKLLRLGMPLKDWRRQWPSFPQSERIEVNRRYLSDPTCNSCTDKKPCYFHSKKPVRNKLTGDIEFRKPQGNYVMWLLPPHAQMDILRGNEGYMAVDGNGRLPEPYGEEVANATVFRHWLPSLLAQANKIGSTAVADILLQYRQIVAGLAYDSQRKLRPSWLAPSSIEPSKPHCSHPWGLDLRKVFADAFGLERVEFDFDFGATNTMRVEEELRVGYRQHQLTPQALHEEILSTIRSHPNYDPNLDAIVPKEVQLPENYEVVELDAVGGMTRNGVPVTSTSDFVDFLDEEVEVGQSGEVVRTMTRRQQLYGYTMGRGYFGKRSGSEKTAVPAMDNEMVIFDYEADDGLDATISWGCPDCNATYQYEKVELSNPLCGCGGTLIYIGRTHTTHNPRGAGGVGSAILMDTENMMERQRLFATLCPHWELNTSTGKPIRLDDVAGPNKEVPAIVAKIGPTTHEEVVKVLKVGTLTPEQIEANRAYQEQLDAVLANRSKHMESHPSTSREDLLRLYPTPAGTVYQERIAGSLSKMGGV